MKIYYKNELLENLYNASETREYRPTGSVLSVQISQYKSGHHCMFLMSYSDFDKKTKSLIKTPKNNDKLYFDNSSKYPRYKLQHSDFKRCIKPETADCVVYNEKYFEDLTYRATRSYYAADNYIIIECTENNEPIYYFSSARDLNLPSSAASDAIFRKLAINNILSNDAKIIYEGKIFFTDSEIETNFVYNVLEDVYPALITNESLDKLINDNCDKLDEDTLFSIQDMLNSTDKSVVDMGLKLLTNYNVNEYRYTIFILMRLYESNIKTSNAWNSTGIKQLRDTLHYTPSWGDFPNCILVDMQQFDKIKIKKQDKELAHKIVVKVTSDYTNNQIKNLQKNLSRYNIKINAPTVC